MGLFVLTSCANETGLYPKSSAVPSEASVERYVRRAYVDLTGKAPSAEELVSARDALLRDEASPAARLALVSQLLDTPAFANQFVDDLRTLAFNGVPADRVFRIFCRASVNADVACESCPFDIDDPCACDCAGTAILDGERKSLANFPDRFQAREASSTLERELASMAIYQMHGGSAESLAMGLFEDFFDRPAEPDEIRNVGICARGSSVPGMGCTIFRENASDYRSMVDRMFASEVYRESAIARLFRRYLGRDPSPMEYRALVAQSPPAFDTRPIVLKLVASTEYFEF